MLKFAWRNLIQQRLRLAISVGGVALAMLLILVMSGLFAGSEEHAVIYIRNQPAAIWVMQAGVENIHMASSILPADTLERVRATAGVAEAVGVLYVSGVVEMGDTPVPNYIFGIDPDAPFGGPWSMPAGSADLALNEIVIDHTLARRYNLDLGDTVSILGYPLTIAGLSEGTAGIATSMVFVNRAALALGMGVTPQAASYILVQADPGTDPGTLIQTLRDTVPQANVMYQNDLINREQELVRQMGTDVIRAMSAVAYVVGLLVIGLTIYTATLERAREYGVLKAIGADNRQLLSAVLAQAFIAAGLGYVAGVGLAYGTAAVVGRLFPDMLILIEPSRWLWALPVLVVMVTIAAFAPIRRVMKLDPMAVFQA
jgi:putative ABC transport system permease protein